MARLQQARDELGQELRELRKHADLSQPQLAQSLTWPQSKVSKIETGRQTPSESDIVAWTRAVDARGTTGDLTAKLRSLESMYAQWRRELASGTRAKQQSIRDREKNVKLFRIFEAATIPGLLQTAEFARARLAQSVARHGVRNDVDEGVRTRMQRQEILYERGRKFQFVLTEAALRYRLAAADVMAGQLERLVALSTMRTLRLGIIPFDTRLPESPRHGFWILDEQMVIVETLAAELVETQPEEIELYVAAYGRLATAARYGSEARDVITRVIDDIG